MKVTVEHSAQMATMREAGIKIPKIVDKFKEFYSRASIYRHASILLGHLGPTVIAKIRDGLENLQREMNALSQDLLISYGKRKEVLLQNA